MQYNSIGLGANAGFVVEFVEVFTLPHVFRTIPMQNATESDGVQANLCGVQVSPRGLAGANLAGTPM